MKVTFDFDANEFLNKGMFCDATSSILSNNITYLLDVFNKSEKFHLYGGNLKAVENLLNEAIDSTYLVSGANFFPYGDSSPLQNGKSIKKFIKDSKQANDKYNRGGYGDRSNYGHFENLQQFLTSGKEAKIDVIEPRHHFLRWKAGLGPNFEKSCKNITNISFRTPKLGTEEKTFCSLKDTSWNNDEKCNIMSIGSNRQWGFEVSFLKLYPNCTIHTFDCTTKKNPKKPLDARIKYYPYCISKEERKVDKMVSLPYKDLVEKAQITSHPDILKLDVDGFEYDVFTNMLETSKHLLPLQISVELHYATRMYEIDWERRWRTSGELALFSSMMFVGGYIPVKFMPQRGCDSCMEVLFVKILC